MGRTRTTTRTAPRSAIALIQLGELNYLTRLERLLFLVGMACGNPDKHRIRAIL
jgi:hypothetical protein